VPPTGARDVGPFEKAGKARCAKYIFTHRSGGAAFNGHYGIEISQSFFAEKLRMSGKLTVFYLGLIVPY